jgi:hypothetical protein
LQEGFQTLSHQERTKDTKKDYFFLRELSVYLVFAERRIPANWRGDLGVEQFICSYAALFYYEINLAFFCKKIFKHKDHPPKRRFVLRRTLRNPKEHKGKLELLLFLSLWTLCTLRVFVLSVLLQLAALGEIECSDCRKKIPLPLACIFIE